MNKEVRLQVRITENQMEGLERWSTDLGMSVPDYVRHLVNQKLAQDRFKQSEDKKSGQYNFIQ